MWSLQNSPLYEWREASFTYQDFDAHRIIFEGIRGTAVSDIAIDDISFSKASECGFFPDVAKPNGTVTNTVSTTRTTTKSFTTYTWLQQSDYDCNFENDFCSWSNDNTANFNWTRGKGPTPNFFTGNSRKR